MTVPRSDEMALMLNWSKAKLSYPVTQELSSQTGCIKAVRQHWNRCMVNRSIESEVLTIGKKTFTRGIAVHTDSEVIVKLPSPGKTFTAKIGRDQNVMVRMERADFVFIVEVGGKEVYKSKPIHGGEAPIPISVPLKGAKEFTLKALGSKEWGHADWVDADIILENGQKIGLDELPFSGLETDLTPEPPFSFQYEGLAFRELVKSWETKVETQKIDENQTRHVVTYRDPKTQLTVTCEGTVYSDYPVVEWVLYLKNNGQADTPIIENIQVLDTVFRRMGAEKEFSLFSSLGSDCAAADFQPQTRNLAPKDVVKLGGVGGRASTKNLPFMNIMAEDSGAILAIGWSGQWATTLTRNDGSDLTIRAGLERTHFKLHPGEQVRTPRALLMFWKGDFVRSQNLFRRFILDHYTPRPGGKLLQSPITNGVWGMVEEKVHTTRINIMLKSKVPFDQYWIDAGWYGDCVKIEDWVQQAGNWFINKRIYPNGFKPISELLHKNGKGFLLWFDCERAWRNSRLHKEHPEWLIELENNEVLLFDLGNPNARQWLTEFISGMITEQGIDTYRQDFNLDPLEYWKKNDAPDRQGISEMKHIEGMYLFWDELLRRHPNLIIDNCSSGGRRIELETTKRSIPLWRSDLQCCPWYSAEGSQSQTYGLSMWLPLHSTGAKMINDEYDYRSAVSSGFSANWPGLSGFSANLNVIKEKDFPITWVKKMMTEAFFIRDYHYGDFYPVTGHSLTDDVWMAYQLDRPDWGKGIILAYRREKCPYPILTVKLQGLDPKTKYQIDNPCMKKKLVLTGRELMEKGFELKLEKTRSSVLIKYKKAAVGKSK